MAKKKKEPRINLLPQEEFQASTLGRVLKWLLTTFRYIVIATEMIVMIAFLSRFWLDARSGDLTDAINQKKAIIASYSKFENTFRSTQNKLKTFVAFTGSNSTASPIIADISSKIPANIILTDISINGPKIEITAQSPDVASASNFINNLNSSTTLQDMQLTSVESKSAGTISFIVSGQIKGRGANGS